MERTEFIPFMPVLNEQVGLGIVQEVKDDTALVTFVGVAPSLWMETNVLKPVDMRVITVEYQTFLLSIKDKIK